MNASNLNEELVCDFLELVLLLTQEGQVNMNTRPESRPEVGRTGSDVAQVVVSVELRHLLDLGARSAQSLEHGSQVRTVLHRDYSQLVFFIHPHQKCLLLVVEDASSIGPVSVESAGLQEAITLLEEEVVVNQLLAVRLAQVVQGVVSPGKVSSEFAHCFCNLLLDLLPLIISNSRS
jgi:hypothetical protein